MQLKDLLRCFAAVECLAPLLNDADVTTVLQKWSIIEEIANILSIPSEVTTAVESQLLTLSDLFGILLRMELKLKKFKQNQNPKTDLAEILLEKFYARRVKLVENPAMKCAVYLDPRYNYELSSIETKIAKYTLENLHLKWKQRVEPNDVSNSSKDDSFEEYQRAKRKCIADAAKESTDPNSLPLLMEKYETSLPELHYKESILKYWESHKNDDPILYQLACIVNTIAPTQVTVERAFSILNLVYNSRRTSLDPELLEHLLLVSLNKEMVSNINMRDLQKLEN